MNIFGNSKKKDLVDEVDALKEERKELKKDVDKANRKLKDIESEHKRKDDEIKHMVKMRQESLELEKKQHELKCEKEQATAIAIVKDEYRDKMEERLGTEVTRIQEMYEAILQRLPTVSVRQRENHTSTS